MLFNIKITRVTKTALQDMYISGTKRLKTICFQLPIAESLICYPARHTAMSPFLLQKIKPPFKIPLG